MTENAKTGLVCHMFPGQGSQKKGMGEGLFEQFPELVKEADSILGYSIRELCLQDVQEQLNLTQFTQPALFVVNALSFLAQVQEGAAQPNYVAGHSLGEYNALFAAEVFDFATGLRLVQKRGELMATAEGGGMAAVVGLDADRVSRVLESGGLQSIDLANLNTPTQIVISGPKDDVLRAKPVFEAAGAAMFIPLNVSGAFHSRYMVQSQSLFRDFLASFAYGSPKIPVIANVDAQPYAHGQVVEKLANQLTHSVRWVDSIQRLRQSGVSEFKEIGPGKVLTGLVRKIPALQNG